VSTRPKAVSVAGNGLNRHIAILHSAKVSRAGGNFHYVSTLIQGLGAHGFDITVFYDDPAFDAFCFDSPHHQWIRLGPESVFARMVRWAFTILGLKSPVLGRFSCLKDHQFEILLAFESTVGMHLDIPFVTFIGDVMYKYFPDLPEYSFRHRLMRGLLDRRLLRWSARTVVDSEFSLRDLVRFYRVPSEKMRVVPMGPPPQVTEASLSKAGSEVVDILRKYHLPPRFMFYPAQFWHHKNHIRMIRAIHLLRERHGESVPIVFVGSSHDSTDVVDRLVGELGVEGLVFRLGYVPEKDLVALYRAATALVFASFADYTNIPVLEAMALGTPVACSNVFAMPEQVGAAGLLFDPHDEADMAAKMLLLWQDDELRKRLVTAGYERVKDLSSANFIDSWALIIRDVLAESKSTVEPVSD
jgi:glycosyltransferase involved in cell wall biosynthesis